MTRKVVSAQRFVTLDFIRNSSALAVRGVPGEKRPAAGWDPRLNTEARSAQLLKNLEQTDDNVGAHFCNNIVDVDVDGDGPHLTAALDAVLPDCAHVWGRKSRPRTHRAYALQGVKDFNPADHHFLRRIKKIDEVKIEVRGGPKSRGEFSLMPGSVHPSGEEYEWADLSAAKSSPTSIELPVLLRAIRFAGAVAVLAPHWQEGIRQELAMSFAGFLHRAGAIARSVEPVTFHLEESEAAYLLDILMRVAGDDRKDRAARLKALRATWRKADKGNPVLGATNIAGLTGDDDIVSKLYTLLTDSPDIAIIDDFCSRFIIWRGPALVVDIEAMKSGVHKPFMTRANFSSSYGDRYVDMGGKRRLLPDMLWHLSSATRVNGVTFDPTADELVVSTPEGDKVNQWTGFEVAPAGIATDVEVEPFLDYMRSVLASDDEDWFNWIMGWCADLFKHPADKCGTALVLVGEQGAGKSFLGHYVLGPIIGSRHYVSANSIEHITRNFNVAYANRLLIQCDEAMNSRQRGQAARLKALITDPVQLVEPKGVDPYFTPLHARMLFTSNELENAVHIDGAADRRYTVIEVSAARRDAVSGYWSPLVKWLSDPDNLAKVHRYLLDFKYSRDDIRRPLKTAARDRMRQSVWEPLDGWLATMLSRGHPLSEGHHRKPYDAYVRNDRGDLPDVIDRAEWPTHVNMTAMVADYRAYCRAQSRRDFTDMNESHMSAAFKRRRLRLSDASVRVRIKEYDLEKNVDVVRRLRIYPAPQADLIAVYLKHSYGFEVET